MWWWNFQPYGGKQYTLSVLICSWFVFQPFFRKKKKLLNEGFRPEYRLWFSSCVVGGLGPLLDFLCTKCSANFSRDKDPFMGRALYNQNSRRILALFFYLQLKIYPSNQLFIKDSTSVDTGQTLLFIHIVGGLQCNFIGNLKPDLKHAIYLTR